MSFPIPYIKDAKGENRTNIGLKENMTKIELNRSEEKIEPI